MRDLSYPMTIPIEQLNKTRPTLEDERFSRVEWVLRGVNREDLSGAGGFDLIDDILIPRSLIWVDIEDIPDELLLSVSATDDGEGEDEGAENVPGRGGRGGGVGDGGGIAICNTNSLDMSQIYGVSNKRTSCQRENAIHRATTDTDGSASAKPLEGCIDHFIRSSSRSPANGNDHELHQLCLPYYVV